MRYHATVCTGLEFIAAAELRESVGDASNVVEERGHLLFDYEGPTRALFSLRSINHLCTHLAVHSGLDASEDALPELERIGGDLDLSSGVSALAEVRGGLDDSDLSFRVTADRTGKHDYTSHQIAAALGEGVRRATGWRVDLTGYDVDVRADLDQDLLVVGVRLTQQSLHRRNLAEFGRASLKATVAYGLIRLAEIRPEHVFADPLCGGGTIPIEATQVVPGLTVLGGDIDPRALANAAVNRAAAAVDFPLFNWDARALPLANGCVDRLIANLPFGVRIGSHRKNRPLYRELMPEVERVLAPGGRAVLLSLERRLMASLLPLRPRFRLMKRFSVNIGGLMPSAYVIQCRD